MVRWVNNWKCRLVLLKYEDWKVNFLFKTSNNSFFSGYAETIGGMIEKESGISRRDWHEVFSGVPRRETLLMAASALAHSYHKTLLAKVDDV